MVVEAQKAILEAAESQRCASANEKTIWRSPYFSARGYGGYVRLRARWDDTCVNGTNSFFSKLEVADVNDKISDYLDISDAPAGLIPDSIQKYADRLEQFNGCHPFGPWYYIENTVYLASDRDHNGRRKGDKKQIMHGGKVPAWELTLVDENGNTVDWPEKYVKADTQPLSTGLRLEYRPWYMSGEGGKERELDAARRAAIWPDATDEELMAPDLKERLLARLPALISEFRSVVEELGFQW